MASLSRLLPRPRPTLSLIFSLSFSSSSFSSTAAAAVSSSHPPLKPILSDIFRKRSVNADSSSSSHSPTLKSIFSDIYLDRNVDSLVHKFKEFSHIYRFRCKRRIYEVIIQRLASSNRFDSIEQLLEHQKQFPDIKTEGFAVRIIQLYGKSGMFGHARKLFDELPQLNCPRTIKSFNALLAAGVNSKEYEAVFDNFRQLPFAISVKPDNYSFSILIQAFCKMGDRDSAPSPLDLMKENGVRPNLNIFNSLLKGLYGGNHFVDGEKVWAKMEEYGVVPDILSYNIRLRGLVSKGMTEEAVKLFNELGIQGLKPDHFSFNSLIKGYCSDGRLEEAKQVYSDLKENGCSPDCYTFQTLIPCASKRDLEFAMELCEESMKENCTIDVEILQGVIDALVRELRIDEAKKLLETLMSESAYSSSLKLPLGGQ